MTSTPQQPSEPGNAQPTTEQRVELTPEQRERRAEAVRIAREKQQYQADRAASRRRRQRAGGRDMVLSMLVLLVPILLIVWFFTRTPDRPQVTPVDAATLTKDARAQATFPLLAPVSLPSGWVPVRAVFTEAGGTVLGRGTTANPTWVMGYQGPDELYYELDEQSGTNPHFVSDYTSGATSLGTTVKLNGRTWQEYQNADKGNQYLVHTENGWTAIVGGAGSFEAVEAFAGTLSTTTQAGH